MNIIEGYIKEIKSSDTFSDVKIQTDIGIFHCVLLESPSTADYLKLNNNVKLIFKETDFILCKDVLHSFNTIEGVIKSILKGKILTKVIVENKNYEFSALITNPEFESLNIQLSQKIYLFVKPTNIILEV